MKLAIRVVLDPDRAIAGHGVSNTALPSLWVRLHGATPFSSGGARDHGAPAVVCPFVR